MTAQNEKLQQRIDGGRVVRQNQAAAGRAYAIEPDDIPGVVGAEEPLERPNLQRIGEVPLEPRPWWRIQRKECRGRFPGYRAGAIYRGPSRRSEEEGKKEK